MKALATGLAMALLAAPALGGEAEEALLYHWGECTAVGLVFADAVQQGSTNPRIMAAAAEFQDLWPRLEAHTNGLAGALNEERGDAVMARLVATYDPDIQAWKRQVDPDAFILSHWAETMDRCIKEATALPVPGRPVT